MQRAHVIKLVPNKTQLIALNKAVGCARFTFNWALTTWKKQYELSKEGKAEKPTIYRLSALWSKYKPEWAYESPKDLSQRAIFNLGSAYINFWNGRANAPAFKKKGVKDSFYISNSRMSVYGRYIRIPVIGPVKMTEELRFSGKIMNATITKKAGDWFVHIHVEVPDVPKKLNSSVVGVDVGAKSIAVASDGTVLNNPKLYTLYKDKLAKANQLFDRTKKDSKRRGKVRLKLQRLNQKITNVRQDAIHKFTTALAKNHGTAVIETL